MDASSSTTAIDPRVAAGVGGPKKPKKFTFRVDLDQAEDLYSDVSLNRTRHGTAAATAAYKDFGNKRTDIQVAAETAIYANLMQALNGNVRPAIPLAWADPLTVTPTNEAYEGYGHAKKGSRLSRVGWGLDPSSLELTNANFQRVHQLSDSTSPQRRSLQKAYAHAATFFEAMGTSPEFGHAYSGIAKLQRELESREMDSMWSALNLSYSLGIHDLCHQEQDRMMAVTTDRATNGPTVLLNQLHLEMNQAKLSVGFLDQQAKRYGSLRIVMMRRNLDDPGSLRVYESAFFGQAHAVILSEIAKVTTAYALRYAFESVQPKDRYAAHLERIKIRSAVPVASVREGSAALAFDGVRVTLPPAPQGYYRGSVVILFRKQTEAPPASLPASSVVRPAPNAFITEILLVGRVPDRSPFQDQHGHVFEVASKPASFVLYHSGGGDGIEPPKGYNYGAMVEDRTGSIVRWEATYDMAWLETVSGGVAPTKFHSIHNMALKKVAASYLSPGGSMTSHERIEVFVEHLALPETVVVGREARRVNVNLRGYGSTPFYFFKMPQNRTKMRIFSLHGMGDATAFAVAPGQLLHEVKPPLSAKDRDQFKKDKESLGDLEEFYSVDTVSPQESFGPPAPQRGQLMEERSAQEPLTVAELRQQYLDAMIATDETRIIRDDDNWNKAMQATLEKMSPAALRSRSEQSFQATAAAILDLRALKEEEDDLMQALLDLPEEAEDAEDLSAAMKVYYDAVVATIPTVSVAWKRALKAYLSTAMLGTDLVPTETSTIHQIIQGVNKQLQDTAPQAMSGAKLTDVSPDKQLEFEAETEDELDPSLLPVNAQITEQALKKTQSDHELVISDDDFMAAAAASAAAPAPAAETEDELDSSADKSQQANAGFVSSHHHHGDGSGGELSEQEVDKFVAETEDEADV